MAGLSIVEKLDSGLRGTPACPSRVLSRSRDGNPVDWLSTGGRRGGQAGDPVTLSLAAPRSEDPGVYVRQGGSASTFAAGPLPIERLQRRDDGLRGLSAHDAIEIATVVNRDQGLRICGNCTDVEVNPMTEAHTSHLAIRNLDFL